MQKRIFVNNQIRAKEVRLIDEQGKQIGVVPIGDALRLAQERRFDLIQVTERVEPPVCKLGDYGKYLYQQEKKSRETRKHFGEGELKEVRITFGISPHDLETRAHLAQKFLEKGYRVKISLLLRGRQKALKGFAKEKLEKFLAIVQSTIPFRVERDLKNEPRGFTMVIVK